MDNGSKNKPRQPVSSYLLRPLRDLQNARLESIDRKSRADAWAKGADPDPVTKDTLRAAQSAFPEMSSSAVSEANSLLPHSK